MCPENLLPLHKGLEQVGGVGGVEVHAGHWSWFWKLWGQGSAVRGDALALLAADGLRFNSARRIAVPVALHRSFP